MSFLEMLDVVNEELIRRARSRSRSITIAAKASAASCWLVDQRHAARSGPRHHDLPAPHAPFQGRRHDRRSNPGAPRPFPSSKIWSSTAARSIASSGRRLHLGPPAARPTPTRSSVPKDDCRTGHGRGRVHRLRRLRRRVQERFGACSSWAQRSPTSPAAAGPGRTRYARVVTWSSRWTPKASAAAPTRRMRGRLPEGDLDLQHRPDEPRLSEGDAGDRRMNCSDVTC